MYDFGDRRARARAVATAFLQAATDAWDSYVDLFRCAEKRPLTVAEAASLGSAAGKVSHAMLQAAQAWEDNFPSSPIAAAFRKQAAKVRRAVTATQLPKGVAINAA